ncbi:MAG TPA: hypothetical protein PKZ32_07040 [Candidatus Melainabacteria bacterium]|nr:hypothetical protein [Candidatus Melainabacteria bacterium]
MKPAFKLTLFLAVMAWAFSGYSAAKSVPDSPVSQTHRTRQKLSSYDGVVAQQTSNWGLYTVKACPFGIRIETQNKAVCVAHPPDWTVYIFRRGQKRAAKITYAMFRTKNLRAVRVEQLKVKPYPKRVLGIDGRQLVFDVNQKLQDTTMGGLYLSRENQPVVLKKEFVFASRISCVPSQAKGIWSNFFEVPLFEEIPLQIVLHLQDGEKRAYFDTKRFSFAKLTADDFMVPSGLSYTAQFAEMIYGKEMEGVADLLYP